VNVVFEPPNDGFVKAETYVGVEDTEYKVKIVHFVGV
jgi:hypothetical protein